MRTVLCRTGTCLYPLHYAYSSMYNGDMLSVPVTLCVQFYVERGHVVCTRYTVCTVLCRTGTCCLYPLHYAYSSMYNGDMLSVPVTLCVQFYVERGHVVCTRYTVCTVLCRTGTCCLYPLHCVQFYVEQGHVCTRYTVCTVLCRTGTCCLYPLHCVYSSM